MALTPEPSDGNYNLLFKIAGNTYDIAQGGGGGTGGNGATGATGVSGGQGSTGATGLAGGQGSTGATGVAGGQGSTGATGTAGGQGSTGATGTAGIDGATGATGIQGEVGATGVTGDVGATGLMGDVGATGITGDVGATGVAGETGATGIAGATGLQGDAGATGAGATGATGLVGATGLTGQSSTFYNYQADTTQTSGTPTSGHLFWNNVTQASATTVTLSHIEALGNDIDVFFALFKTGDTFIIQDQSNSNNYQRWNINGTPNIVANSYVTIPVTFIASGGTSQFANNHQVIFAIVTSGLTGATGLQGSTGATGIAGSQGATGSTGLQGIQGATGIGATGATGVAGNDGSTGATGIGEQGATGIQGATGLTGATGPAGGGGSITPGTIDNAVLRADGTSGTLLQNSDIIIDDATTSTQNNVAIRVDHQGQTNSSLVLTPEGTGAFILGPKPDGTITGGNARGAKAVDLQISRNTSATEVATGTSSVCIGLGNTSTASGSIAMGRNNLSSAQQSIAIGNSSQATSIFGVAIGRSAKSDRRSMYSYSGSSFSDAGESQYVKFLLSNRTTDNTPTELFLDGTSAQRLTIPAGKIMNFTVRITGIRSNGTDQVGNGMFNPAGGTGDYLTPYTAAIKNVSATTTLLTIFSNYTRADGVGWVISADDTLDCLKITVTGKTGETWRWIALVEGTELAYGT